MSENETSVLTITPKALERVLRVRENSGESSDAALEVKVTGLRDGEFSYDMAFTSVDSAEEGDAIQHHDDLPVIIRADSVDKIRGSTLDLSEVPGEGLTIDNPNDVWDFVGGELARRVQEVLDTEVNPSIAMHGGRADLVAVEEQVAYLRLGGGCQGCGLAKVTLSQGIEVAIQDAVPEIERVVDVTDHAAGQNPYYEAAKK